MRKRTIKLWRLQDDGRKLFAGTIEAGSPAELVAMWSAFLVTAERGFYFATYRGSFMGPETALESATGDRGLEGTCGKGPGEGSLGPRGFVHPLRGVGGGLLAQLTL